MDAQRLAAPITTLNPSRPYCVEVGTSVADAIDAMQEGRFGCMLVLDQQQLVGIITERDLSAHIMGLRLNPADVSVDDIMTASPESLSPGDPIAFALNLMHLGRYRHIPLLDAENGHPVGIVSSKDIFNHLVAFLGTSQEE
ncbi:MAG: CBS domain-containing protein [Candidatus Poribacteria bacterium]|nr:CBS domain-containing protein [Candidatus Poribacteria bacterium]